MGPISPFVTPATVAVTPALVASATVAVTSSAVAGSRMGNAVPGPVTKFVNSNLGRDISLPVYVLLLPWPSALMAAWLVWTQQKQEMSSLNLNFSLWAWS